MLVTCCLTTHDVLALPSPHAPLPFQQFFLLISSSDLPSPPCQALTLVPRALQLVCSSTLVMAAPPPPQQQPSLGLEAARVDSYMCHLWARVAELLHTLACVPTGACHWTFRHSIGSLEELGEWCASAAAALRTLEQAAAVRAAVRCGGTGGAAPLGDQGGPDRLANALLSVAYSSVDACQDCLYRLLNGPTGEETAASAALASAWQLHSAVCRLAHRAAAGGAAASRAEQAADPLPALLNALECVHLLGVTVEGAAAPGTSAAPRAQQPGRGAKGVFSG